MKELPQMHESIWLALSSAPVIGLAFSELVRKLIGKRDHWECQEDGCDRSFANGDMVHASHLNHDKSDPAYDTEDMGEILCVPHHLEYHLKSRGHARDIGLTEEENNYAIRMLLNTDPHTKEWRKRGGQG